LKPLNLASRPFRNRRLPRLLLALFTVAVAAVSVRQAAAVRALLPDRTSAVHAEEARLQRALLDLRAEATRLSAEQKPDKASLGHWKALADLVDRRLLSWTRLLERLEAALPDGVRLLRISPVFEGGGIRVEVQAEARTTEEALDFIQWLEDRPEFAQVYPASRDGEEPVTLSLTMWYLPGLSEDAEDEGAP
jgi:Tfp pilus assembly protein PilN